MVLIPLTSHIAILTLFFYLSKGETPTALAVLQKELLQRLIALRKEVAALALLRRISTDPSPFQCAEQSAKQVKPYMVFSQPQLEDFCKLLPTDIEAFRTMEGVSGEKLLLYGARFTQAIREFVEAHPEIVRLNEMAQTTERPTARKRRNETLQASKAIARGTVIVCASFLTLILSSQPVATKQRRVAPLLQRQNATASRGKKIFSRGGGAPRGRGMGRAAIKPMFPGQRQHR